MPENPSELDARWYDEYDSGIILPEDDPLLHYDPDEYADIPTKDELPAMQAWEEQNAAKLAKLPKRKKAIARFDALKEIRIQRAREQIEAASPDEASESDAGSGSPT